MPGKTGSGIHDRIVAIPEHIIVEIAKIRRGQRICLLRHPDPLRPLEEDELWTVNPVSFDECAVPCRTSKACNRSWRVVVRGRGIVNGIAEPGSKPRAV